jgi:hypothetical protein
MDERIDDLPPAAAARVRRQARSRVSGSLLSPGALAAVSAVGLEPVGEVMGCVVMHLGWNGSSYGCGDFGYRNTTKRRIRPGSQVTPIRTTGTTGGRGLPGYEPYITARYQAYDSALGRMLTEAAALGADGVIGVDLRWSGVGSEARELIALGTAVRDTRPPARRVPGERPPFATELSGEDVAKAVLSGWAPLGMTIGLSMAVKHHDWGMDLQTSWLLGYGNTEVDGFTQIVQAARMEARHLLALRARGFPGAAQVVVSQSGLNVSEHSCAKDQIDHVADASFVGTVLAHHPTAGRPPEPAAILRILPLGAAKARLATMKENH